jgi:hypothetical protein
MGLPKDRKSRVKLSWISPDLEREPGGQSKNSCLPAEKLQEKGATVASVWIPSNWKSVISKHCEVLKIALDPYKRNGYYSNQKISSMRVCDFSRDTLCVTPGKWQRKSNKQTEERVGARKKL